VRLNRRGYAVEHCRVRGMAVPKHRLIVEAILGRFLPARNVVHHVNEMKQDNRNQNLVACENQTYHLLLHSRRNALLACGNADYRRCGICRGWDTPSLMSKHGGNYLHRRCAVADQLRRRRARGVVSRQARHRTLRDRPTCTWGHVWTDESTYAHDGRRYCRTCANGAKRARRERGKALLLHSQTI
jgi:hypothetical protein